jgi:hypothetical protein
MIYTWILWALVTDQTFRKRTTKITPECGQLVLRCSSFSNILIILTILLLTLCQCCLAQESWALKDQLCQNKIWTWWRTVHKGMSTLPCKAMAHSLKSTNQHHSQQSQNLPNLSIPQQNTLLSHNSQYPLQPNPYMSQPQLGPYTSQPNLHQAPPYPPHQNQYNS